MKKWGWLMLGMPENIWEPPPPPPQMPWMRDLTKGKGAGPPVAPPEVPLGENPDAAFARWL